MRHLLLPSTDPALNLAPEEALLRLLESGQSWLPIWQNTSSVIIGRHQSAQFVARGELLHHGTLLLGAATA